MATNKVLKDFAKSRQKAKDNWRSFKNTGNVRYKKKADYFYGIVDGYTMTFQNPTPQVNIKETHVQDSFNLSKNYGINGSKTSIKTNKTVDKRKPKN